MSLLLPVVERAEVEAVVMLVRRVVAGDLRARAVDLARTLVEQGATALALVRARAEAGTDAVTGCMNHRAMRRRLDEEIGRAMRTGGPLSCLLIDLDDFKMVNDQHGHPAGDAMLREVVRALVGEFRAFDRVARYGGDEFVVILPNADLESAAAAANRALERLRALPRTPAAKASRRRSASPNGSADEHRRAARSLRRRAAALQAPGQGPRHARVRRAALRLTRAAARSRAPARDSARLRAARRREPDARELRCRRTALEPRTRSRSATASYEIFRLDALQQRFDVARLPFSLKILLENLLRTEGNGSVDAADIEALAELGRQGRAEQGDRVHARRAC